MTPADLLRALADPERLALAGALARAPRTARALAEELDLPLQRTRRHLPRLAAVGPVRRRSSGPIFAPAGEGLLFREDGQYWRSGGPVHL